MKRNLLQVAVVSVLLLMGCTGCDDTLGGATDVTAQREVLTTFS